MLLIGGRGAEGLALGHARARGGHAVTATELLLRVARDGLLLAVLLSAPAVLAALATSVVVGVLQAATQVHEPTIPFVPRLLAVLASLAVFAPWIASELASFTAGLFDLVPRLYAG
jgi:flagellar biosynthesis protein FliQ